ncbi:MAG: nicotinamidase [Planctomycetia bacterium]|nr:nicotinamidase [Planctomycetia bacterium]
MSCIRSLSSAFIASAVMLGGAQAQAEVLALKLRSQTETAAGTNRFHVVERSENWDPKTTALIVCDVWDYHHCLNAVRRLEEFGPRLNAVVHRSRELGMTIIHAPSDCMPAYAEHPARARAIAAPKSAVLPPDVARWCSIVPSERQAVYPLDQSDGGEDDDPQEHAEWAAKLTALGRNPKMPWKRQSDMIKIDDAQDFISDKGEEVWNILEARGIKNVVLTGVHLNMCVLGRPFGLRRMMLGGKNAVLLRDLTDTMYNPKMWPYVAHFTGNDRMVAHVEQRVCPTISSDQILGDKKPFRYAADKRPHVAIVVAEEGYGTAQTLPDFANRYLGDFRVSYVFGSAPLDGGTTQYDIPGLEVLDEADVAILSIRRKVLKPEQMAIVRRFVAAKKPVIGIRTTSHAFALKDGAETPQGYEAWPTFDVDVLGAKYLGHSDSKNPAEIHRKFETFSIGLVTSLLQPFERVGGLYRFEISESSGSALHTAWSGVQDRESQPVAWTFVRADGSRSYYTSLGEAADFDDPLFLRLLLSGVFAATGQTMPEQLPAVSRREELQRHWMMLDVPSTLAPAIERSLDDYSGPLWLRCVVRVPSSWSKEGVTLELPDLRATDQIWFNGKPVTAPNGNRVEAEAVAPGDANLIVVRRMPTVGMKLPSPRALSAAPVLKQADRSISLAGKWRMRIGDDPAWSNMPLPAKFGAATDYIIEASTK